MNTRHALKNLPYLDGWRGLAIFFLLVGHFFPVPGINLGSVGVNLFFVLSGFLMARLLFLDQVAISIFYKRRIARIFPTVFFFIVAMVLTYMALGQRVDWAETAAAASFLLNYFPGEPGAAVMPFGHIWSLCVEEHSYILLSLAAVAVRSRLIGARTATGLLALASALTGLVYWLTYRGVHLEFDRWIRSEVSAFGILASAFILLALRERPWKRVHFLFVPALIAFGFAMHWWSVPAPMRTVLGVGAFALAVNLLDRAPKFVQVILSLKPLHQLGIWSFSIYLWQQPFYLYVHRSGASPVLAVIVALIAGIASFYLIEQPARTYLNRKWTSHKSATSLPVVGTPGT